MNLFKFKNYFVNFITLIISISLGLLIVNLLVLSFPSQKFFPRSLANSLPNALVTFYPDTYKKNNLKNYTAILGDSLSQGNGDGYLNGTYDYSIGHHLNRITKKNYLIYGRAGFGSISAVSNLIKVNKISNFPNFIKNLDKPESIIFFFSESTDLEDNFFEYTLLSSSNENINKFVSRRIKENINLTINDKLVNLLPVISITNDLYEHLKILYKKLTTNNDQINKKSLVIDRIKKLFGFTVLLDNERKNNKIYRNSIKNRESYKNILPLHSAASDLTTEEILISLDIFFESIRYIKSWSETSKILIVYLPSPVSCYIWNEPIEYRTRNLENTKNISNQENNIKSKFIRKKIQNFSKKNHIKFIDVTEHIKETNTDKIIFGPLDWSHFNYDGYKVISDYIINNI